MLERLTIDHYLSGGIEKLIDARLCICSHCHVMCHSQYKGKKIECNECYLTHLIEFELNYNDNIYDIVIKRTKEPYGLDLLESLDYNNSWLYEHFSEYKSSGIYGIYIGSNLVYIGKSKNILARWIAHIKNIKCNSNTDDCNKELYNQLRKQYAKNKKQIIFQVIEYCLIHHGEEDKLDSMLSQAEDRLILLHKPRLNILIPDGNGGYCKKKIEPIDDLLIDED